MALRNRLLIAGGALAGLALLAVLLVAVFLAARTDASLEHAADRLQGQNLRLGLKIRYVSDGEPTTYSGMGLYNADGTHLRMDVDTTYEKDAQPFRQTILMIERETWVGGAYMEYALPSGKRWVHGTEPKDSVESIRMNEVAEWLRGAVDVSKEGEGTIRDQHVTHFRGHLSDGTIEAWVDDDNRPARIAVKTKEGGFSMDWKADVLQFGPQVLVQAPPRTETIEEEEWNRLTAE